MRVALVCLSVVVGVLVVPRATSADVDTVVVFEQSTDGHDCYRLPAIIEAPNGDLLAFAEGRNGGETFCNDFGDIDLVYARSTDNGATWSSAQVLLTGDGDKWGNPVAIVDGDRIVVVIAKTCVSDAECDAGPYVMWSDDSGGSWSTPTSILHQLGFEVPPLHTATGPGHGLQLTRGEHAGRLVAGMNFRTSQGDQAGIIYSDDHGETWRLGAREFAETDLIPQELSLVELTDGRIYAAARNQANNEDKCLEDGRRNRAYAISSDGGETFSQGFTFEPDLITPVVQASTLRLRATDTGDRYNRILFAGPSTCDRRKELTIRSSYDEGRNWVSGPLIWAEDAAYSDMTLVGDRIGVLYESGPEFNANETIRWSSLDEADLGLPDGDTSGMPTTPDASSYGNDAYLHGATVADGAVTLDGNDYVQLPFAESLATDSGDFTWTGRFRYGSSDSDQALLWAYNWGADRSQVWLRAEPGDGRIRAWAENGPTGAVSVSSSGAYDDEEWHSFTLRRDGGTLALFIDGAQVASASGLTGSVSPGRPFPIHLGQRLDGADPLVGSLDEIQLYNHALTADTIAALAAGDPGPTAGLQVHLCFSQTNPR